MSVEVIRAAALGGVAHGFLGRRGGVSTGAYAGLNVGTGSDDDAQAIAANRALATLNSAFPPTRAFAREILPGVRETPATIKAAFPWLEQANKLLGEKELRGLVNDLRPTTANLSKVVDGSLTVFPQADLVAQCVTKVILPTGDIKIDEGGLSTGTENYKEFWYTMVGLAGESQIAASREQGVVALPLAGRSPVLTTYLLQPDREPSDAVAHFIERLRGLGPADGVRTVSTGPETSQECEP